MHFKIKIISILICFTFLFSGKIFSINSFESTDESGLKNAEENKQEEKFEPGAFIMEHIGDSHEWHIATIGKYHLNIPLLIITYSKKQSKLLVFCTTKFKHGCESYNGIKIETEGKNKGKLVEVDVNGKTLENAPLPVDFSITKNVLGIFISVIVLLWIFIGIARVYKKRAGMAPKRFQSMLEVLIIFVRDDIARPAIGEHRYGKFMPFLLTVFFFIFINNLIGLIPIFPGGANITGNIAITMVLALFTFIITSLSANKGYWLHIVNTPGVPWWLKIPVPLMPLVELIGVFTKPFVLMIRLFANITAGHIIAMGFFSLIFIFGKMNIFAGYSISVLSILFTIFMTFLELLVAFIQAYVFTLLSALYFGMAKVESHHE
jgi:F-type H+-transporting ATPase subunit a